MKAGTRSSLQGSDEGDQDSKNHRRDRQKDLAEPLQNELNKLGEMDLAEEEDTEADDLPVGPI